MKRMLAMVAFATALVGCPTVGLKIALLRTSLHWNRSRCGLIGIGWLVLACASLPALSADARVDALQTMHARAEVTNRSGLDAVLSSMLTIGPSADASGAHAGMPMYCDSVTVPAGGSAQTWCHGIDPTDLAGSALRRLLTNTAGEAIAVSLIADAALGPIPRHAWMQQAETVPSGWESRLATSDAVMRQAAGDALPHDESPPVGPLGLPLATLVVFMGGFALLGTAAVRHLRSARRRILPRFVFVFYMILVLPMLLLSAVDQPGAGPMGGVISTLAQMALALPWTVMSLDPQSVVRHASVVLLTLIAGNAWLLFAFSSRGSCYRD